MANARLSGVFRVSGVVGVVRHDEHDVSRFDAANVREDFMETILIQVKGMSCDGCAKGIIAALRFMPGVMNVDASYSAGQVTVRYDAGKVSSTELRNEIEALDYKVID